MRFGDLLVNESSTMYLATYLNGLVAHTIGSNQYTALTNGLTETKDVRAIALDANDQLWVGAENGLRVLSDASNIFRQQNPVLSDIVVRQDNINQQILNGEFIWDIKVDGANNKWVATADSGVFYFSEDGETALEHFTKEKLAVTF